jgi:osmoprotectant transport system substrate-binding protein
MMRKIFLVVLILLLPAMVFAGGKQEAEEPAPMMEEEKPMEEEPAETGPPKSGIAYKAPIDIGTKNFTEQFLVGNIMYIYLEEKGFDVELKTGMSSPVLREAMENGDLDLCMDYTGTLWLSYAGNAFKGESPEEMYRKAKEYDAENGLVWLDPIWCNNTYAIAVTKDFSEGSNVENLSQFAAYVEEHQDEFRFASDIEFYSRPDGILGMQLHYGFAFRPDKITMALPGLSYQPLVEGNADAAMVFGTDAIVVKENWTVLQDDKNFWPPYDLTPYTRQEVLDANPGLADALKDITDAFPSDPAGARAEMTKLNARVDNDLLEPEEVAAEWLKEKGLID